MCIEGDLALPAELGLRGTVRSLFFPVENELCFRVGGIASLPVPDRINGFTETLKSFLQSAGMSAYNETFQFGVNNRTRHLSIAGSFHGMLVGNVRLAATAWVELDITASTSVSPAITIKQISIPGVQGSVDFVPRLVTAPVVQTLCVFFNELVQSKIPLRGIGTRTVSGMASPMLGGETRDFTDIVSDDVIGVHIAFATGKEVVQVIDGRDPDPRKHRVLWQNQPVSNETQPLAHARSLAEPGFGYCPSCGRPVRVQNSRFCSGCGGMLPSGERTDNAPSGGTSKEFTNMVALFVDARLAMPNHVANFYLALKNGSASKYLAAHGLGKMPKIDLVNFLPGVEPSFTRSLSEFQKKLFEPTMLASLWLYSIEIERLKGKWNVSRVPAVDLFDHAGIIGSIVNVREGYRIAIEITCQTETYPWTEIKLLDLSGMIILLARATRVVFSTYPHVGVEEGGVIPSPLPQEKAPTREREPQAQPRQAMPKPATKPMFCRNCQNTFSSDKDRAICPRCNYLCHKE